MESGRGLVKDIEYALVVASVEMGGQRYALCLTPRERVRRLAEREIAQANILQNVHSVDDRRMACKKLHRFVDRHVQHVVDILALEADVEDVLLVAPTFAGLALQI